MKYVKFISVAFIVLTIEVIILNIINDSLVIHKWHIIIQLTIIVCYVGAFCVLNGEIIDMMMLEWFIKPTMYEDMDFAVNGDTLTDDTLGYDEISNPNDQIYHHNSDDVLDRVLHVDIDDLPDNVIVIRNLNVIEDNDKLINNEMYKDDGYEDLLS